jgi:glycosyltransferase involved in cell wall biosynthesis
MSATRAAKHLFVVPAAQGLAPGEPPYNDALIDRLPEFLPGCARASADDPELYDSVSRAHSALWVDARYLHLVPALRRSVRSQARVFLLAHTLPRDLEHSDDVACAALSAIDGALAPSQQMADLLGRLRPGLPVWVAEPPVSALKRPERARASLAAVMAGSLVPEKGVLSFLEALANEMQPSDRFELRIAGRVDLDRSYAEACCRVIAGSSLLASRVRLLGALPHASLLEALARAHVFVSAARRTLVGLSLAEARAAGLVVLARELADETTDDRALARSFLALARDPQDLHARLGAAERALPAPRHLDQVAREVALIVRALEPSVRNAV